MMLMNSRLCRSPIEKSLGSCAGVTLTQPVPNSGSTNLSETIGIVLPTNGSIIVDPIKSLYLSSSGCTATAVSPSIVSGRVVATTTYSSEFVIGYRKYHSDPFFS